MQRFKLTAIKNIMTERDNILKCTLLTTKLPALTHFSSEICFHRPLAITQHYFGFGLPELTMAQLVAAVLRHWAIAINTQMGIFSIKPAIINVNCTNNEISNSLTQVLEASAVMLASFFPSMCLSYIHIQQWNIPWWRHQLETFSVLLALTKASGVKLRWFLWSTPE